MKKKYVKPSLTRLPVMRAAADGFEILATCFNGVQPNDEIEGACSTGGGPKGALCDMGSSDSGPTVDYCTTGTGATTGCSTGWVATPCSAGTLPR